MGNSRTVHCLQDLVKSHNPDFLFISETLVALIKINEICGMLSFLYSVSVDILVEVVDWLLCGRFLWFAMSLILLLIIYM